MLSKVHAADALACALRTGGDFAEIFYQDKLAETMSLQDGKIENVLTQRIHGAGIRVFRGLNCVYVHSCDTSPAGLKSAAMRAADAIGAISCEREILLTEKPIANLHPVEIMPMDVPGRRKAALLKEACGAAAAVSPSIAHIRASLSCSRSEIQIFNSDGLAVADNRVYTRMGISAVASDGTQNQTGFEGPGAMMGFEFYEKHIDPADKGRSAAQTALTMLNAGPCPAGQMPVVMDGGFGGVVFHEACGHSLEATSVAFGKSEFCGKLGQQIANERVTADRKSVV